MALMHACVSQPQTDGLLENQLPFFHNSLQLQTLEPGWALGVVTALIRELHAVIGTEASIWLGVE